MLCISSTGPTETTPLVGHEKPKLGRALWLLTSILLLSTTFASSHLAYTWKARLDDALSPPNIIRRNQVWKEEELYHQQEKERWLKEETRLGEDYERARVGWADKEGLLKKHYGQAEIEWSQKEASLESDYNRTKVVWAKREDLLKKHYENATIEWSKKEEILKADYERSRAAWIDKEASLKRHYDQAQVEWSKKEAALRTEHEKLKFNWGQEHQRYRRDQEQWESDRQAADEEQRKRAEERKRLGIAWDTPFGHQCTSYGTRPYNAKIVNVPSYMDPVKVCAEMPIQFHGRTIEKPIWCEKLKVGTSQSILDRLFVNLKLWCYRTEKFMAIGWSIMTRSCASLIGTHLTTRYARLNTLRLTIISLRRQGCVGYRSGLRVSLSTLR